MPKLIGGTRMYDKELTALTDCGARFVVVGAVALSFYKYPRFTFDLDIIPAMDRENLTKIILTLEDYGYHSHSVDPRKLLDAAHPEVWFRESNRIVFPFVNNRNPPDQIDLLIYYPFNFEDCYERRKDIDLEGRTIHVASLDDLIFIKKSAMRTGDVADIPILEKLKYFQESGNT